MNAVKLQIFCADANITLRIINVCQIKSENNVFSFKIKYKKLCVNYFINIFTLCMNI